MSTKLVAEMTAVARSDTKALTTTAHTLKGSSGMIGAEGTMSCSESVERAAAANDLPAAQAPRATLARCHAATLEILREVQGERVAADGFTAFE